MSSPQLSVPAGIVPMAWHSLLSARRVLLLIVLNQLLVWTVADYWGHQALPLDNAEEVLWSQSFAWGFPKHPPAPAWLLYALSSVFGYTRWLSFFASNLCLAVTFLALWRLARELMAADAALMAVVLFMFTGYGSVLGYEYNHNIVSLPLITLSAYFLIRIMKRNALRDWALLGLFSGLSLLAKYSAIFALIAFVIVIARYGDLRAKRTWQGGLLFLVVLMAVIYKHVEWVRDHDYCTLHYLAARIGDAASLWRSLGGFVGSQIARLLPAAALVAYLLYQGGGKKIRLQGEARFFIALALITAIPFLLMILPSLLNGTDLRADWFYSFSAPLAVMGALVIPSNPGSHRSAQRPLLVVQAVLLLGVVGASTILPRVTGIDWRGTFPSDVFVGEVNGNWRRYMSDSLPVVATDTWTGAMLFSQDHGQAQIVANGTMADSPWLLGKRLNACQVMVLSNQADNNARPAAIRNLFAAALKHGEFQLPWLHSRYYWALAPTTIIQGVSCSR